MSSKDRYCTGKRGGVLAMTVFAAVFLVGITALVTDVGLLYYNQARLQTAVNAGWKAGFDRMMQFKSDGILDEGEQALVKAHIAEVMKQNRYTDEELANLQIEFGPNNYLYVGSKQSVGLFFARVIDINAADVAAARGSHAASFGQGIVPLAIPHGVVKDLSKNFYTTTFFGPDSGFASGSEYILKLGSGGGRYKQSPIILDPTKRILIPMDSGAQTDAGFLKAYGAVYWCLQIDDADQGYTPVDWLVGYRGGSFLLPYHDDIISLLNTYLVNYQILTEEEFQPLYESLETTLVEMRKRPKVAVYSNGTTIGPIEQVLRAAYVPYGTYSLPNMWLRKSAYKEASNTKLNDSMIINGALANYECLFLQEEDFTGVSKGCDYWLWSCQDFHLSGKLGAVGNVPAQKACYERMCIYCRDFYQFANNKWLPGYDRNNCLNINRRCTDKTTYQGLFWKDDTKNIILCGAGDLLNPRCSNDLTLQALAASLGYADDAGSAPKPQHLITPLTPLPDNLPGWFDTATKLQKMKWDLASTIRHHVGQGGFMLAQGLSVETMELALWQRSFHPVMGQDPDLDPLMGNYQFCLGFNEFHYRYFPTKTEPLWYSDINVPTAAGAFELYEPLDPRCQNHGSGFIFDTGAGYTPGFKGAVVKPEAVVLGAQDVGTAKYLKGLYGLGEFTYIAGSEFKNIYTQRLVLNNLLVGALAEKNFKWSDGSFTIVGRQKAGYGPVDPDNFIGGGASDYHDRLLYGFNAPLEINDRLITLTGNERGPSDDAVTTRVFGTDTYPPNRRIIVPITDVVSEELAVNDPRNADAMTVYDIQGSDSPDGIYDPALYGFGSAVRIIGFAEFEILDPSEYTRDGESFDEGDAGDLGPYQPGQIRGRFIRYIIKPGEVPLN